MRLAQARELLDAPLNNSVAEAVATTTNASIEYSNGAASSSSADKTPMVNAAVAGDGSIQVQVPANIIQGHDNLEVYRLTQRIWLAPFDMGVSQDADILLMPSQDEGLYEMQLRLVRRSGETSAWQRVNRGFISDLRRQLLLWRTIKPETQRDLYSTRARSCSRLKVAPATRRRASP